MHWVVPSKVLWSALVVKSSRHKFIDLELSTCFHFAGGWFKSRIWRKSFAKTDSGLASTFRKNSVKPITLDFHAVHGNLIPVLGTLKTSLKWQASPMQRDGMVMFTIMIIAHAQRSSKGTKAISKTSATCTRWWGKSSDEIFVHQLAFTYVRYLTSIRLYYK